MNITLIEVLPEKGGGWKVVGHWSSGIEHTAGHLRFKRDAVRFGRGMAQGVHMTQMNDPFELQIKDRKGRIQDKDTYGPDPESTKG